MKKQKTKKTDVKHLSDRNLMLKLIDEVAELRIIVTGKPKADAGLEKLIEPSDFIFTTNKELLNTVGKKIGITSLSILSRTLKSKGYKYGSRPVDNKLCRGFFVKIK